eukprot:8878134-Pyramimonas_sp.AAC.1
MLLGRRTLGSYCKERGGVHQLSVREPIAMEGADLLTTHPPSSGDDIPPGRRRADTKKHTDPA